MAENKRRLRGGGGHTCVYFREEDWQILEGVRKGIHSNTLKHRSQSEFIQEAIHLLAKQYKIV